VPVPPGALADAALPARTILDVPSIASFPPPRLYFEDGIWVLVLPSAPVGADGATFDDAVSDFVAALVDYACDWKSDRRLARSPAHAKNRTLVDAVLFASEQELLDWVGRARLAG